MTILRPDVLTTKRPQRAARSLALALIAAAGAGVAAAQQQSANPVCARLEGQLQMLDRGGMDPTRADQIKRFEDAANKQQAELDRTMAQSRQLGCEGRGFFLFGPAQSEQCGPLNARIQQQRANLDRVEADLARLQSGGAPERDAQRRTVLAALGQNDCGPQYRTAAAPAQQPPRGFFESLFGPSSSGPGSIVTPETQEPASGNSFRTVCVRTCDGYYYPISYATSPARFPTDAAICQRSCPASEVTLYTHRNPGEDMRQAVSVEGKPYTALPNAFKYRQTVDAACSCRRPGETWAQALKQFEDQTVERGDVVVNDERARQMSQPRFDAQGKPIRPDPRNTRPAAQQQQRPAPPPAPAPDTTASTPPAGGTEPDAKRPVRSVGPNFYTVR